MSFNYKQGFGLIEVLISLLLTSLILLGLIHCYITTKEDYAQLYQSMNQEFDLMEIIDLIRHSIRHAGFTPCGNITNLITQNNIIGVQLSANSLTIRRMDNNHTSAKIIATELLTQNNLRLARGDLILVADCYHGEAREISSISNWERGQRIGLTQPLVYGYRGQIYIGRWLEEKFYVVKKGSKTSLIYESNRPDELSSFVSSMVVDYIDQQGQGLILMQLGLSNSRKIKFETRIRQG